MFEGEEFQYFCESIVISSKLNTQHSGKKFSTENDIEIFFLIFLRKQAFWISDISYKLPPKKIMCMKCQILFSGKNVINLLSVDLAQIEVKVKEFEEEFYIVFINTIIKCDFLQPVKSQLVSCFWTGPKWNDFSSYTTTSL